MPYHGGQGLAGRASVRGQQVDHGREHKREALQRSRPHAAVRVSRASATSDYWAHQSHTAWRVDTAAVTAATSWQ